MLEIWIGESGVLLRDPASGQSRILENVQSVTFADGSTFPEQKDGRLTAEPSTIRTLSGETVAVS